MKKQLLTGLLLLGTLAAGRAAVYYEGASPVGGGTSLGALSQSTIVDGNPAMVVANTMNLSGLNWSLSSLSVTLNISGGDNSGLYAYLVGPNGSTVTLMNQPGTASGGFGQTGAGMNITLVDSASTSIQSATGSSVLTGSYSPAGSLASLDGSNPNTGWTLYISDTTAGGGNATLNGWSLDLDTVPEPINVALGIFAGAFGVMALGRSGWFKNCLLSLKKRQIV